ncbi:hypothetical protein ACQ4LE_000835 [Meloidogyne hapla]
MAYRTKFFLINSDREGIFTNLLRVVKQWAIARQIYSNVFGYLSGTILLIMSAKICLIYPNANLIFLLRQFFLIYSIWPWPIPLILDSFETSDFLHSKDIKESWNLKNLLPSENRDGDRMPVITSLFPNQNSSYNVNNHTLNIIKMEMNRAYKILIDEMDKNTSENLDENNLIFKQLDYKNQFCHFLLLECTSFKEFNNENQRKFSSSSPPNCGQLKTRVRNFLYRWVERTVIQTKIKQNIILKERLNNYHALSGFTRKRRLNDKNFQILRVIWLVGLDFKEDSCSSCPNYIDEFVSTLNYHLGKINKYELINSLYAIYSNNSELENKIESRLVIKFEEEFKQYQININSIKQNQQIKRQNSFNHFGIK